MNTAHYNDYVLSASVEAGWITDEQQQAVGAALAHNPGMAALDILVEQSLLDGNQSQMLIDAIAQAEGQTSEASAGHERQAEVAPQEEAQATPIQVNHQHLDVHELLIAAAQADASDVHLGPQAPPLMRRYGHLIPLAGIMEPLTPEQTEDLARQYLTGEQAKEVEELGSVDFSYRKEGVGNFRTSCVRQRRGWESVFRIIPPTVRSMDELELPKVMYEMTRYHNGLVLVTGSVGSGKTTTLASLVEQVNQERKDHIITLEDPIEYVFQPKGCQITQREVHSHTDSFGAALRGALRQDPDVIMVGEMRDLETISLAITASETGHLVLATLHTSTAARTMQRLLDVFPTEQQAQIRTMVSESIRGVVCQQLVPRADGNGRVLALEIMTNTPAIANLIREGKNFMIPGMMQTGKKFGMRLMDDSLLELMQKGVISRQDAISRADNPNMFG